MEKIGYTKSGIKVLYEMNKYLQIVTDTPIGETRKYSFVPNCRGWVGGGQIANFLGKKPLSPFIYYKGIT